MNQKMSHKTYLFEFLKTASLNYRLPELEFAAAEPDFPVASRRNVVACRSFLCCVAVACRSIVCRSTVVCLLVHLHAHRSPSAALEPLAAVLE